jgi:hypothetical protein
MSGNQRSRRNVCAGLERCFQTKNRLPCRRPKRSTGPDSAPRQSFVTEVVLGGSRGEDRAGRRPRHGRSGPASLLKTFQILGICSTCAAICVRCRISPSSSGAEPARAPWHCQFEGDLDQPHSAGWSPRTVRRNAAPPLRLRGVLRQPPDRRDRNARFEAQFTRKRLDLLDAAAGENRSERAIVRHAHGESAGVSVRAVMACLTLARIRMSVPRKGRSTRVVAMMVAQDTITLNRGQRAKANEEHPLVRTRQAWSGSPAPRVAP